MTASTCGSVVRWRAALLAAGVAAVAFTAAASRSAPPIQANDGSPGASSFAETMIKEGRKTFRYDTFGDEAFWGGLLRLHEAIAGAANGGVGPGVSPATALAVGLKVDLEALPGSLVFALRQGKVDLQDPATTLALLKLDAVIGVRGFFDRGGRIESIGIQCALCHSTVDDALVPGIGRRLDGWANRDLNVGAIVALAPDLSPFTSLLGVDDATVRSVLDSWGPGKFDAELVLDGKAFRPDGKSAATLLPPAFGLAGVNLHTFTGWGSVAHWNAFVANLEMHGKGTFFDPRLDDAVKFPIAARERVRRRAQRPTTASRRSSPALHFYQLALPAPRPPRGSFDRAAAAAGGKLFEGKAACARCHVPPLFTEPGLEHAHRRRDRHRRLPGQALARRALPHDAAQGPVVAPEGRLLPRRAIRDASRRGRPLRPGARADAPPDREGAARRVPEEPLGGAVWNRLRRRAVDSPRAAWRSRAWERAAARPLPTRRSSRA